MKESGEMIRRMGKASFMFNLKEHFILLRRIDMLVNGRITRCMGKVWFILIFREDALYYRGNL